MKDFGQPRWYPGRIVPSQVTMVETNPAGIIPGGYFVCGFCGVTLLGKFRNEWPGGYKAPDHVQALLVEHPGMPVSVLELDIQIDCWCPNNGKRFFVSYSLTVLELDECGNPRTPIDFPVFKVVNFKETD